MHKQKSHPNHNVNNSNDDNLNHNVNVNDNEEPVIMVTNNDNSETSYICKEILEEPVYYEMSWDDYDEQLIYENNGILDFDERNAMKYDEESNQ